MVGIPLFCEFYECFFYLTGRSNNVWNVLRQPSKAGNTLGAEASWGVAWHPRCAAPRTKECFSVSARRSMFHPYYAWGEEFLGLALLWSSDNWWLGSRQPLRHVPLSIAQSALAEERLPHHTLACLCPNCIPGLKWWYNIPYLMAGIPLPWLHWCYFKLTLQLKKNMHQWNYGKGIPTMN